MPDPFASMTPNVIAAGEKLSVNFASSSPEFKDATEVEVRITEVDDASPLEPTGKSKLLATFLGKVSDNKFTLEKPSKDNPKLPAATPGAPTIQIEVGSTTVDVSLPDPRLEQAVFELRLEVAFKKPKAQQFTSSVTNLVRWFQHFQVNKVARPIITFVAVHKDDNFFKAAKGFWQQHGDAVLAKPGLSLAEIVDVLTREQAKFGAWGQVNIVTHGRAHQLAMKVHPDSARFMVHTDELDTELARRSVSQPQGVDAETEVVFRACNTGQDQEIVDRVKVEFFADAKFVKMPKFTQEYDTKQTPSAERFHEDLAFDLAGHSGHSKAAVDAGRLAAFDDLKTTSPGLGASADPKQELATFKAEADFKQAIVNNQFENSEDQLTHADGTPFTTAELEGLARKAAQDDNFDQKSDTWKSPDARWQVIAKKVDISAKTPLTSRGLWFEVTKGTGTPRFKVLGSGSEVLGSGSGSGWDVQATDVAAQHVRVNITSLTDTGAEFEVTDEGSGNKTTVVAAGKTFNITDGGTATVSGSFQVNFGSATLEVRPAKRFMIQWEARRVWKLARRVLRTFDASKDHQDRTDVVPDLANDQLYATSS